MQIPLKGSGESKTGMSVIVNVCDEAHLLQDCLESVQWADELVIVDMHSRDDSARIAEAFGALVYDHPREIIADRAHNFAIAQATREWILKLDPDERVSASLAAQIREILIADSLYDAYRLPFKDFMFGKWIKFSGWQGNREIGLVRLFRREKVEWVPEVHSQPRIDGEIGAIRYDASLDNAIVHLNYTSVEQFIEKLNRYTSAEAEKRVREGKTFHWSKLIYHPIFGFWRRYIHGKGYRDGLHGFILGVLMAFYSEVILVKMWELTKLEGPCPDR